MAKLFRFLGDIVNVLSKPGSTIDMPHGDERRHPETAMSNTGDHFAQAKERSAMDNVTKPSDASNLEEAYSYSIQENGEVNSGEDPETDLDLPSGRVYFQWAGRYDDLEVKRSGINDRLIQEIQSRKGRLVLDPQDIVDPLSSLERILLGDGAERTFFLSNASTAGPKSCLTYSKGFCPLPFPEDCCLYKMPCNMVLIRPKRDLPSIAAAFPGDEILAVKAYLYNCPEEPSGCVAAIEDFVWAPVCEARPFERELRAVFVSMDDARRQREFRNRPNNLLSKSIISTLPPISLETKRNLELWSAYLDWRSRLVQAKTRAVRYLRAQRNKDGSLSFLVVAEGGADARSLSWLRREELEAVSLEVSSDPWTYLSPDEDAQRFQKRRWPVFLGEAERVVDIPVSKQPIISEGCPWDAVSAMEVWLPAPDDGRETPTGFKTGEMNETTPIPKNIPETGFLRICQWGDVSLIKRMSRTISSFAQYGSSSAPFLSSYIFDIQQARLPQRKTRIDTFLNPSLNDDQKRAVQVMLDAPDIALVQGPPGTGKTTVIAEAIWQFAKAGKTVLLASQSIAAVENALDRLEHVPEIRVCLRRKARSQNEGENAYSDDAVLRAYYETLGKKAHEAIGALDQMGHRSGQLQKVAEELAPLVVRLAEEARTIAETDARAIKAGEAVQAAEARMEAARSAALAKATSMRLVDTLPLLGVNDIGDWARDVPEIVLAPLANALSRIADALGRWGVSIWTDIGPDEPHRPSDVRLRALVAAIVRIRRFVDAGIPAILGCIHDWSASSGERLLDDDSARRIQSLRLLLNDVERKRDEADEAGDEDAYSHFNAEFRRLRKAFRDAEASASTPLNAFREWFTVPMPDGQTLADAIAAAAGNRSSVLSLVDGFESFAIQFRDAFLREQVAIADAMRTAIATLAVDDGAESALRMARMNLQEAETLATEARNRREAFSESAAPILARLRGIAPDAPDEPAEALEWSRKQVSELERKASDEHQAHPWLEPVLREWDRLTSNPTPEDREKILPVYLSRCNVVGITCTANERLLEDLNLRFDVVIVDEVSKATPPELISPMMRGAKTILVGDHRQLPPLFDEREPLSFEEIAQREEEDDTIPEDQKIVSRNFRKYEDMVEASLFKRHFEQADPRLKCSLWIQHRMHPDIMDVINVFYEGRLKCGIPQGDADRVRDHGIPSGTIPWIAPMKHAYWIDSTCDPKGVFFQEEDAGTSKQNMLEARLIVHTLQDLDAALEKQKREGNAAPKKTVGVISFYGRQKGLLIREVRKLRLKNLSCKVETVDRFQGQESDYVLVSMTRNRKFAKKGAGIRSFIARFERINVAFSRARELLLVFGAKDFFRHQPVELPSIDGGAPARKVQVYAQITDMLARRGTLVASSEVISPREWAAMPKLTPSNRQYPAQSANSPGSTQSGRFHPSGGTTSGLYHGFRRPWNSRPPRHQ